MSHILFIIRLSVVFFLLFLPISLAKQIPVSVVPTPPPTIKEEPSPPVDATPRLSPLEEYLQKQQDADSIRASFRTLFSKPFSDFTEEDYAFLMSELNLARDNDLFLWSSITDIPIVALRKTSYFFRMNRHLIEDTELAQGLSWETAYQYKTLYNHELGTIEVHDEYGYPVTLRDLPKDLLMPIEREGKYWYFKNFANSQINYTVLAPYLIYFSDLPYRSALVQWIAKLPLNIVKTYRGKAIYLTNITGRSFATTMPVSNKIYKLHVGLKTGVWIEMRRDGNRGTERNFIHEFGHVYDYTVIQGGYGQYRDSFQFPAFRRLFKEKEAIFGAKDNKVPDTSFGYISRYSKVNAQENFAEHFRAFIMERDLFKTKAEKEAREGHPELMQKYQFMKKMIEDTSTQMVPLSKAFLQQEPWS